MWDTTALNPPFNRPNWPSSAAAPPGTPPEAPLHASASHAATTASPPGAHWHETNPAQYCRKADSGSPAETSPGGEPSTPAPAWASWWTPDNPPLRRNHTHPSTP